MSRRKRAWPEPVRLQAAPQRRGQKRWPGGAASTLTIVIARVCPRPVLARQSAAQIATERGGGSSMATATDGIHRSAAGWKSGEGGIRTRERVFAPTRLAGECLQPLGHLSFGLCWARYRCPRVSQPCAPRPPGIAAPGHRSPGSAAAPAAQRPRRPGPGAARIDVAGPEGWQSGRMRWS